MQEKDEGYVLRKVNYGDTGVIASIFTRKSGLKTFIASGVRKRKPKFKPNYFQPFTKLEITYRKKENANINRLYTASVQSMFASVPFHFFKSAQAVFMGEVLIKSLKDEDPHADLFRWLENNMMQFDRAESRFADFHLFAVWQWTRFLGFEPQVNEHPNLDLLNAEFIPAGGEVQYVLGSENSAVIKKMLQCDFEEMGALRLNRKRRKQLLESAVMFYQIHFDGFTGLKSVDVLEQVMENLDG